MIGQITVHLQHEQVKARIRDVLKSVHKHQRYGVLLELFVEELPAEDREALLAAMPPHPFPE